MARGKVSTIFQGIGWIILIVFSVAFVTAGGMMLSDLATSVIHGLP